MNQQPVYILDGLRSPVGKIYKGFKNISSVDLTSPVIQSGLKRLQLSPEHIQEVIVGNAVSAGMGQNIPRAIALAAGLPAEVPAYSVGNVCASGLQSLMIAFQSIMSGHCRASIAAAVEIASNNPELVTLEGKKSSSLEKDGLLCSITGRAMGDLCEDSARRYKIPRPEQDQFSFESHQKAVQAHDQGAFSSQIVPIKTAAGAAISRDESPRRRVSREGFTLLPPVFQEEGTITAGNASAPADGSCVVFVASGPFTEEHRCVPLAKILGYASSYVKPENVFLSAGKAITDCCRQSRLRLEDIDLFEICEAFAAQVLITRDQLKIPPEKLNIHGGDIALGHPLGAAGLRCLVTLVHALKNEKKRRGVVCVCFGGGGAIAMAVEIVN